MQISSVATCKSERKLAQVVLNTWYHFFIYLFVFLTLFNRWNWALCTRQWSREVVSTLGLTGLAM